METIREILLSQYIGAITIGVLAAQGVIAFVTGAVRAFATYYGPESRGVMVGDRAWIAWFQLLDSSIITILYFVVGYLLLRWLYLRPEPTDKQQQPPASSVGESSPL